MTVRANRLGHELGDSLGDAYRQKLSAKIGSLVENGDMRTLAQKMSELFKSLNIDTGDVISYLRDSKNSLEYRKSVSYALAVGVRGPIKRSW